MDKQQEVVAQLFRSFSSYFDCDLDHNTLAIYGEWCGNGIQKGVAVCNLRKMFVIFGVKCVSHDGTNYWLDLADFTRSNPHSRPIAAGDIYNIHDFPTYSVTIDISRPEAAQNIISDLTLKVEEECPVGKFFGVSGIGEGIVWTHLMTDGSCWLFKTKGTKHSATKVKTIATVDLEKVESVSHFVEMTVTTTRLSQALEHLYCLDPSLSTYGKEYNIKDLGKIIEWVRNDIIKEDSNLMGANNLTIKDIMNKLSTRVAEMFKVILHESAPL
jgi:hypothetical protein